MSCSGLVCLSLDIQAVSINVVFLDESVSKLFNSDALFVGTLDHLIVDIREVLNEGYIVTGILKISGKRIKSNKRSGIAEMEIVIDRWAASIHLYLAGLYCLEFFFCSCECIVKFHS